MEVKRKKGFTLIELLIVIGIIAVLMSIAIVAINPGRQFAKANNARRWGDVGAFADAIAIRIIDEKGSWPLTLNCEALPTTAGPFALAEDAAGTDADIIDLCDCLVSDYFGMLPVDPGDPSTYYFNSCSDYDTGYEISGDPSGRIKISAPGAQDEGSGTAPVISVGR